jgi:sugar lactone lactonase YvrE
LQSTFLRAAALSFAAFVHVASLYSQSNYATPYSITTFAGSPQTFGQTGVINKGSTDGTGGAARFNAPAGVAVDSSGNVYVADSGNHVIRKITSAAVVTTLAGTAGVTGSADGTGSAAQFNDSRGVAVDTSGNVYVADGNNTIIRKITPSGVVTTLAGTAGAAGAADGTGSAARFRYPYGVAVDNSGNVYVADTENSTIRKITPAGVVTTLAGEYLTTGSADGTGNAARFFYPHGIAVDTSGNIFVADSSNGTIRKVTPAGAVTTFAGTAGNIGSNDGTGTAAEFNYPESIAVDASGYVYVGDFYTIRKISPAGVVTTLAGVGSTSGSTDGIGSAALFNEAAGIAVAASGVIYIGDLGNDTIRAGSPGTMTAPNSADAPAFTTQPISVTVAGGTVALDAVASNSPSYQWFLNGSTPVAGATGTVLFISNGAAAAGSYTCVATNSSGSATSAAATVTVSPSATVSRLTNLSARAAVGTSSNILFAGFASGPAGQVSGAQTVFVRASGPALALAPFNLAGALADPELQMFTSTDLMFDSDTGWKGNAQIASTAAAVGAFSWGTASTKDSALIETVNSGSYTAQVAGASGDTGLSIAEIYDTNPFANDAPSTARLVNLSARAAVGTGANILFGGFTIGGGATARTVLIRASGPALAVFGLASVLLPDPQVVLVNSAGTTLASNTGWGASALIISEANAVGAFSWGGAPTKDSALLITLPAGAYTAQVSGVSGDTGQSIIEVYEVP